MKTIHPDWRDALFEYLGATIGQLGGKSLGVGGTADHVHILASLNPTSSLSDTIRELKKAGTKWIRSEKNVGKFAWQEGYGAFTVSPSALDSVRSYVLNQEEHHRALCSAEEFRMLLDKAGIEYDPKYLS